MHARPYQHHSIAAAIAALQDPSCNWTTMLIAPTGAGKTFMLSEVINEMLNIIGNKKRVLVLVHRKKINMQNKESFEKMHGRKTSLFAGDIKNLCGQVIFGMVQTIGQLYKKLPAFDMIVIDEFHHACASSYLEIIEDQKKKNPNLYIFGVTATPNRGDRKGLQCLTNNFCAQIFIQELIELGYLMPLDCKIVDLFPPEEIRRISSPEYFGQCGESLLKSIQANPDRKKIVIFTTGKQQMFYMEHLLKDANIGAVSIHSDMNDREIATNLYHFEKGKCRVLLNIDIATEGYDYPPIDCIIMLRRIGHKGLYMQMAGRGLRIVDAFRYPGYFKKNCLLIDFGDNVRRFGKLEEEVDLIGKNIYLPAARELAERDNIINSPQRIIPNEQISYLSLHERGCLETFTFEGEYIKGACGKGNSLFSYKNNIFLKKKANVVNLKDESQIKSVVDEIIGNDKDFFENLKNLPIESYQMQLLLDKFDLVGCSKYRASVLINFLAIKDKLCISM